MESKEIALEARSQMHANKRIIDEINHTLSRQKKYDEIFTELRHKLN